jgi:hypothetical protein
MTGQAERTTATYVSVTPGPLAHEGQRALPGFAQGTVAIGDIGGDAPAIAHWTEEDVLSAHGKAALP